MKKFLSLMLAIVAASVSATMLAGTPINQSELPKAAQTFITKYFSRDQVKKIEKTTIAEAWSMRLISQAELKSNSPPMATGKR